MPHPSKILIDDIIDQNGHISLWEFMSICLHHPEYGYYVTAKNPLGRSGDFTTSPEISQIFGELIGVFILYNMPSLYPKSYAICELGAGNGTLLSDVIRVVKRKYPPQKCYIYDKSNIFKEKQKDNLNDVIHISDLSDLPEMPVFFLANEFFDALAIHAYKVKNDLIYPMNIARKKEGHYYFTQGEGIENTSSFTNGYYENCPEAYGILQDISHHITSFGGVGLICDYGHAQPSHKFTFRGFYKHKVTDGLGHIGMQDLTADVDFSAFNGFIEKHKMMALPIIKQSYFITSMYGDQRLGGLLNNIEDRQKRDDIISAYQMLTDPDQMGDRFKFLCLHHQKRDIYPFSSSKK